MIPISSKKLMIIRKIRSVFFTFDLASSSVRNQCAFRHSARKRLLNTSMNAMSVGFPGREK